MESKQAFLSIYFKFSEHKFLLVKFKYGTYFSKNARLQGQGCPKHAVVTLQRQISENLIYREPSVI